MDANVRNFEAELEAQHVENEPQATKVHADTEVAVVTAL